MDMLTAAQDIRHFLQEAYHHFHQYPELSHQEIETSQRVAHWLKEAGLEVWEHVGGTGVVGLLRGMEGTRTIALRADMDALPIQEETDSPFASRNQGRMHACGHDAHMAMLLGAARLLKRHESALVHNVKFIFQPAEEFTPPAPGARPMIEAGVLRDPDVNAIVALHVWPAVPAGKVGMKQGPIMAAFDVFEFELSGPGGHGALPHETVDVVVAAAEAIMAFQTIVSRRLRPTLPAAVTVGSVEGGTKQNVIPTRVTAKGSARYVLPDQSDLIREGIEAILKGISIAYGVNYRLNYTTALPPTINDDAISRLVLRASERIVGKENIEFLNEPAMASEDFSLYLEKVPGCMFFLGTGNAGAQPVKLHSASFQVDEKILPIGAAVLAQTALDYSI